jgi:hypothetical protein
MKFRTSGYPYHKEVTEALSTLNVDELWDFSQHAKAIVQKIAGDDLNIKEVLFRPSFGWGRSITITGHYKGPDHRFVARLWDNEATYFYEYQHEAGLGWLGGS